MSDNKLEWISFYEEFADKLLEYKDNRKTILDKIQKVFSDNNMNLSKLDDDGKGNAIIPDEIDPFTVYGFFNKQLTDENRIKIISGFKKEFSVNSPIPTNFDSIPVLNNFASIFYTFGSERGEKDIDKLWNFFESAIELSRKNNEFNKKKFIEDYNTVLMLKRIRWNITMALYWIRPSCFINLDAVNRKFLADFNNSSKEISDLIKSFKEPPKGDEYLNLCEKCNFLVKNKDYKFDNFSQLSKEAYNSKEKIQKEDKSKKEGIGDNDVKSKKYWVCSPGEKAKMWDEFYRDGIIAIGWEIDDLNNFNSKTEIVEVLQEYYGDEGKHTNDALCLWQFSKEIQVGDVIFAKTGMDTIVGMGIVQALYEFRDTLAFPHVIKVNWCKRGIWKIKDSKFALKTLTDITNYPYMVKEILEVMNVNEDEVIVKTSNNPIYSKKDFLDEAYLSEEEYETLVNLLKIKKNLIIQGAPGVGKTFLAKRLAYSIMGIKDMDRCMMIQFHQSYSYEDFIMGFRPVKEGFELKNGSFYEFCKKAEVDSENDYFFIIDEINRGNISKIFGELFMLIENDKRGDKNRIQLVYSDELFYIPENVYIIGLMNTADRSLAMIDYALRRRFAFFDLKPGFSSDGFVQYQRDIDDSKFDRLIEIINSLNDEIKNDETLGKGFVIGHSYFCNLNPEDLNLDYIVEYEIIPLLREYWFDENEKVENWSNQLRSVIK